MNHNLKGLKYMILTAASCNQNFVFVDAVLQTIEWHVDAIMRGKDFSGHQRSTDMRSSNIQWFTVGLVSTTYGFWGHVATGSWNPVEARSAQHLEINFKNIKSIRMTSSEINKVD